LIFISLAGSIAEELEYDEAYEPGLKFDNQTIDDCRNEIISRFNISYDLKEIDVILRDILSSSFPLVETIASDLLLKLLSCQAKAQLSHAEVDKKISCFLLPIGENRIKIKDWIREKEMDRSFARGGET